ncbi:MAG: MFS transporter [Clostridia bacterium]|nr:MFS transporter [Clostridia bacterium]
MDFESKDIKRSRTSYLAQSTVEYFVSLLVTDAFLAKLLTHIGISDSLIGIISSFITMAFVIQLISIFIVRLNVSTKRIVITCDTISIFFFMLLYLVPFIPVSKEIKTVLVMLSILLAYAGKYTVVSLLFKWANSYVSPSQRARYSANKEIISLVSGMVFTAVIGRIIDKFEGLDNLEGAFLFITIAILILNISNFICLLMIKKEDKSEHKADNEPFSVVLKHTLGNKNFRNVVILTAIWNIARYFTVGFLGVYKTKDLMMSLFLVQIINIVSNAFRVFVSKPIARYSDRHTYAKGFELGLILELMAYIVLIFTTNKTWWLIIVFTILFNCSYAGTNQNSSNITYSYVDSKYIAQAMAIKNCIGGVFGFAASLLGGKVLDIIQSNGNMIFGIHIYGQQVLAGITVVMLIITLIFTKTVIAKQTVMKQ